MANTWKDIRSKLMRCSETDLMGTIHDLYKLDSRNKGFLEAKFANRKPMIKKYSHAIVKSFTIKQGREPWDYTIDLKQARSVLNDYKKATGDADGLIELMMVYAESGMSVITDGPSHKQAYYTSIRNMIIKLLAEFKTNEALQKSYFKRMKKLLIRGEKFCGFAQGLDPDLVNIYIDQ